MSKREETAHLAARNEPKRRKAQLAPEQDTEVREAFELFDPHRTAYITYHELKVILRALGFEIKKSEVVQLAREFDIE
jgi:centrin-3